MKHEPEALDTTVFSDRLRQERQKRGLKQTDMAEVLHIPKSSLCYYESGKAVPSLDKTYQLADILNLSLDFLCGRDNYRIQAIETKKDLAEVLLYLCKYQGIDLKCADGSVSLEISDKKLAYTFEMLQMTKNYEDTKRRDMQDSILAILGNETAETVSNNE